MSLMDLGHEVVKTKKMPFWHHKGDYDDQANAPQADQKGDDDDGQTDARIEHPHMVVEHCPEELHDIPDEGTAVVRYKVSDRSMRDHNGKKSHSIVIDIKSFEPQKKAAPRRTRMSDYMDGRMHSRK